MSNLLAQALGTSSSTAKDELGARRRVGDKEYRYVLLDLGAATASLLSSGHAVAWKDSDAYEVTVDFSAGLGRAAGVIPYLASGDSATLTDAEYAYVQIAGDIVCNKPSGDDSMTDGMVIILGSSSEDGKVSQESTDPAAVADIKAQVGVATAASDDTADTVAVRLAIAD